MSPVPVVPLTLARLLVATPTGGFSRGVFIPLVNAFANVSLAHVAIVFVAWLPSVAQQEWARLGCPVARPSGHAWRKSLVPGSTNVDGDYPVLRKLLPYRHFGYGSRCDRDRVSGTRVCFCRAGRCMRVGIDFC
jgi:hypothetical protein